MAQEGAKIVLTARRLEQLQSEMRAPGSDATFVVGDAREEATAKRSVQAAVDTFGRLDLLNNAGVGNTKNGNETGADDYDEMMDSNARSISSRATRFRPRGSDDGKIRNRARF